MTRRIVAVVPARGGSKGLPGKNLRRVGGRTLIERAFDAAAGSGVVDECVLTTDDETMARVGEAAGVTVVRRPAALATDDALTRDVVLHALDEMEARGRSFTHLVLLQPTSPLRSARHVRECVDAFFARPGAASALSVTEEPHHPAKAFRLEGGLLEPLMGDAGLHAPRQSLPTVLRQNGAIYVTPVERFRAERSFYLRPAVPYRMAERDSIDIDTELDLELAEWLTQKK